MHRKDIIKLYFLRIFFSLTNRRLLVLSKKLSTSGYGRYEPRTRSQKKRFMRILIPSAEQWHFLRLVSFFNIPIYRLLLFTHFFLLVRCYKRENNCFCIYKYICIKKYQLFIENLSEYLSDYIRQNESTGIVMSDIRLTASGIFEGRTYLGMNL